MIITFFIIFIIFYEDPYGTLSQVLYFYAGYFLLIINIVFTFALL